jgi:hypothetical protein
MKYYKNAHDAIRDSNGEASGVGRFWGIGYAQGHGWFLYDLNDGLQHPNSTPEFMCCGLGKMPIPLSDAAKIIVSQLLESVR